MEQHKLEQVSKLLNDLSTERKTLLETLNRIHQIGKETQMLSKQMLQLTNKVQAEQLGNKPQEPDA